jgi:putative proteasome-type protease
MTYCLAISLDAGLVLASDSRTHGGVDYVRTHSKMHVFGTRSDRLFVLLSAGNLATTQAVVNRIHRDIYDPDAAMSLNTCRYLFEAADYVGEISFQVQQRHAEVLQKSGFNPEASFILGGQIAPQPHGIFMLYAQGNHICASPETPYLQIGESKYGKPILDRVIEPGLSLEDAARCALLSLDSTMRSNISVGPPVELLIYRAGTLVPSRRVSYDLTTPYYASLREQWHQGLNSVFKGLPAFEWE